ncbi:MAG TPA: TolC family protein [Bryobacteraceae bacterium]|jgi:outer membrane protein TolC|nr:TolC family protein [Bryobacteraceae bacterium]
MTGPREFLRQALALTLCYACGLPFASGQTGTANEPASIEPSKPSVPWIIRPYLPTIVPPARIYNSGRFARLIQGGSLYLTVQDAVALALENNIDIEIARYNPIVSAWNLERSEAGGALPGVPSGSSQASTVTSGQGVAGSQASAGVNISTGGNNNGNARTATVTQIGPVTQTLDPTFQQSGVWQHSTSPQPDAVLSQVASLISNRRIYTSSFTEGTLTGGTYTVGYTESYLNENTPTDLLNPSDLPNLTISFQHNLLQGFGVAVNARTININKVNVKTADLNFKTTVIGTVINVLNLYYGLSADFEDLRAKKSALEVAQKFYEDNQKQVQIGTLAPLDVTTAESQVASSQLALVDSQAALDQQESSLKNTLSRTGINDPVLKNVTIIPLDRIVVPEKDELPPLRELVAAALTNRPDLEAAKNNLTTLELSALGTKNSLLPGLEVFGNTVNRGLAGVPKTVTFSQFTETANPYITGPISTALGQIFRRNYPSESIGAFLGLTIFDRQAIADQIIDQLTIRQTELTNNKDVNQVSVDVSNQVVALQQARARYDAAIRSRILEQQLFDSEQKKFSLGASTPYNVVLQQRDLIAAQSSEVAALVAYSNAHLALEQVLGTTLADYHVNLPEAMNGKVARVSNLPNPLPKQP